LPNPPARASQIDQDQRRFFGQNHSLPEALHIGKLMRLKTLRTLAVFTILLGLLASFQAVAANSALQSPRSRSSVAAAVTGWDAVPGILARIKPPVFPNRDFKITDYGAVADGTTDSTEGIRKAIAACNAAMCSLLRKA